MRTTSMTCCLVAVLCCITTNSHAEKSKAQQADDALRAALARDHGPGMMAAVAMGGDLVWSGATGMADVEQEVSLTTTTRMRTASVSKSITALLVARLIDAERMSADTDIRGYVPGFPDKGAVITPRQIAAHTSGIRHYDFSNMLEANNIRVYERLDDALPVFAEDPLLAPPGSAFEYSSLAYNLLGVAAAAAAETSFGEALSVWVTDPLGLSDTLPDHPLAIVPRRSRFYTVIDGPAVINTYWRDSSDFYPSGGILSTAGDLARLTSASFGKDFLSKAGQTLLRSEATTTDGVPVGYSFGWQVKTVGGQLQYSHGGESNGAHAQLLYIPKWDLAVAGITNYNVWGETLGEPSFFALVKETLPEIFQP